MTMCLIKVAENSPSLFTSDIWSLSYCNMLLNIFCFKVIFDTKPTWRHTMSSVSFSTIFCFLLMYFVVKRHLKINNSFINKIKNKKIKILFLTYQGYVRRVARRRPQIPPSFWNKSCLPENCKSILKLIRLWRYKWNYTTEMYEN